MTEADDHPPSLRATEAPPRTTPSNYPPVFAARMVGRVKRPLGDPFGLASFGVNHVTMAPGAVSALHHRHSVQDEFVLVLTGRLVLIHDAGETVLAAGDCAGFPHGSTAHHLANRSDAPATYLEVGDRQAGDTVTYPDDDLQAARHDGVWRFEHKNGEAYS